MMPKCSKMNAQNKSSQNIIQKNWPSIESLKKMYFENKSPKIQIETQILQTDPVSKHIQKTKTPMNSNK